MSPEVISAMAKVIADRHPWTGQGEPRLQGEVERFINAMCARAGKEIRVHGSGGVEPHSVRCANGAYVVAIRISPTRVIHQEFGIAQFKSAPPGVNHTHRSVSCRPSEQFEKNHANMAVIWRGGAL